MTTTTTTAAVSEAPAPVATPTRTASAPPPSPFVLDASRVRYVEGRFTNARGKRMFYCAFFPPLAAAAPHPSPAPRSPVRGVVLFLHGIGEHSHRFTHVYEHLLAHNYGVLAYDLAGHGRSVAEVDSVRAHAESFRDFVDDTNRFVRVAKTDVLPAMLGTAAAATVPLVCMAISFGALVALHTVLSREHTFHAIVLAAPAIDVKYSPVLSVLSLVSKPLSWLVPTAKLVPGVDPNGLSRDPAFLDDCRTDPLHVSEPLSARMGEQIMTAMRALADDPQCKQPESAFCALPILIVHGSGDTITSLPMARAFLDSVANSDKHFEVFDGLFHCVFHEPEKQRVLDYITQWLVTRVDGAAVCP